jgi:hypothetical protein
LDFVSEWELRESTRDRKEWELKKKLRGMGSEEGW